MSKLFPSVLDPQLHCRRLTCMFAAGRWTACEHRDAGRGAVRAPPLPCWRKRHLVWDNLSARGAADARLTGGLSGARWGLGPAQGEPVSSRTPFTNTERGVNPRNWSAWSNSSGRGLPGEGEPIPHAAAGEHEVADRAWRLPGGRLLVAPHGRQCRSQGELGAPDRSQACVSLTSAARAPARSESSQNRTSPDRTSEPP